MTLREIALREAVEIIKLSNKSIINKLINNEAEAENRKRILIY